MPSQTLFSSIARWLCVGATAAVLTACQSAPTTSAPAPQATTTSAPAKVAAPAPVARTAAPAAVSTSQDPTNPEPPEPPVLGKHTDAHGCKPSTGHAWCARTNRCERPWELALQRGFANTPAGWHAYCDGTAQ